MVPHIVVIDPGVNQPELEAFNRLCLVSPTPLTYHQPALHGFRSLAEEDLEAMLGLIIFGSGCSVNERLAWQSELERWTQRVLDRAVPTLGLCYGHQMLAAMLGGQVGFAWPDQHKAVGLRTVDIDSSPMGGEATGALVVSHRETVTYVPDCMRVIGRSTEIASDVLVHKTLPIYSFQSHPEATATFLADAGIILHQADLAFGHSIVQGFLQLASDKNLPRTSPTHTPK